MLPRVLIIPTIVFALAMYSHVGVLGSLALAAILAVQFMVLAMAIDFIKRRSNA